jgi:hypothetical protein
MAIPSRRLEIKLELPNREKPRILHLRGFIINNYLFFLGFMKSKICVVIEHIDY